MILFILNTHVDRYRFVNKIDCPGDFWIYLSIVSWYVTALYRKSEVGLRDKWGQ
jgi:hypothetical protein